MILRWLYPLHKCRPSLDSSVSHDSSLLPSEVCHSVETRRVPIPIPPCKQIGRPVTNACMEGYNGTIFCYGQTGSGKTFTTFGPPSKPRAEAAALGGGHGIGSDGYIGLDAPTGSKRGLVPRVLEYLFERFANASQESSEAS